MEDPDENFRKYVNEEGEDDILGEMQVTTRNISEQTMKEWAEDRGSWTKSIRFSFNAYSNALIDQNLLSFIAKKERKQLERF